jgi:hypothetical protein
MNVCQNVIDEHGNTCGDEGRMCEDCMDAEMRAHAYLRGAPRHSVVNDAEAQAERDQELRDAGRAHLVRP